MKLHEAMNTYNTALLIIKEKGYRLDIEDNDENAHVPYWWIAQKGNNRISASNPLSLLALVTICEQYGDQWNCVKTGDIYADLVYNSPGDY